MTYDSKQFKADVDRTYAIIRNGIGFPLNIVFFPYHLLITLALAVVKVTNSMDIPWYLVVAPSIISLLVVFYMVITITITTYALKKGVKS